MTLLHQLGFHSPHRLAGSSNALGTATTHVTPCIHQLELLVADSYGTGSRCLVSAQIWGSSPRDCPRFNHFHPAQPCRSSLTFIANGSSPFKVPSKSAPCRLASSQTYSRSSNRFEHPTSFQSNRWAGHRSVILNTPGSRTYSWDEQHRCVPGLP